MRGIKLKAWEKSIKEIIPVYNINFESEMINTETAWRDFNEVELIQYTGLNDKKDNEIYDGFLVSNKTKSFHGNGFGGKNLTWLVEWDQNECCYKLTLQSDKMFGFKRLTKESAKDIEIIGNKFKNPDILKKL